MYQTLPFSSWGRWSGRTYALDEVNAPSQYGFKAFMGWDGIIISDPTVHVVDLCRAYMDKVRHESCGQCFPCRLGTQEMWQILERICQGRGIMEDLNRLSHLADHIKNTSKCGIGLTSTRPVLDALAYFPEAFEQALQSNPIPRGRYIGLVTAPCMDACPSHLDIPGYVDMVRMGRPEAAFEIICRDCSLPGSIGRTCLRPCESHCRRAGLDQPVAINALKRFTHDRVYEQAAVRIPDAPPAKADRVAIVGAGPAGLSCAYYLGVRGYQTTLFETLSEPGGRAAVGIPDYRLPRGILHREVEIMQQLGAEFRYNTTIGENIKLQDLLTRHGYQVVFLAIGAQEPAKMRCEGEDAGYHCFMTGLEFLKRIALGEEPLEGNKLLVVGGGNVAMDCVRSAVRTGFSEVHLLYRRTQKEMPADPKEFREAREEGVQFHFLVQPLRIQAEHDRVTGLECIRMELGKPDDTGRRRPVPVEGSEFVIPCDAIVPAIGQTCVVDCVLSGEEDVQIGPGKTLVVDEITHQSSNPRIFSGGDCITGPDTLIRAIAAGKQAARHIVQFLQTGICRAEPDERLEQLFRAFGVFDAEETFPYPEWRPRAELPVLDPDQRLAGFQEVESGYTLPQALYEASRCLRCYRVGLAAL
ncbi:MAG: FAD-dependent oxidoreductase [Desulfatiglandaceae bacterium]